MNQVNRIEAVSTVGRSRDNEVAAVAPFPSWPSWSACNAKVCLDEKKNIGKYFADHYFLSQSSSHPEASRLRAGSVLVIPGTTPNCGVRSALHWMEENWKAHGPFNVTWYTPAAVAAQTIRDFREEHQHLRTAAALFLFPGHVDPDVEAVIGDVPVDFARVHLSTHFTYSLLSSYTFDLRGGNAFFYYIAEVGLQRACAALPAEHKFLFLPEAKFAKVEGKQAYGIRDLFATSNSVTILTAGGDDYDTIKEDFEHLGAKLLLDSENGSTRNVKELSLCIVNADATDAEIITKRGHLTTPE